MMGRKEGIGKNQAKFQILDNKNLEGMSILEEKSIDMNKYIVHTLYDYLAFRTIRIDTLSNQTKAIMIFDTPLTIKYQNEFIQNFQTDAILSAIRRRIYMLDCFEGIESDISHPDENDIMLKIYHQKCHLTGVSRYSNCKNEKMILRGLKGYALLEGLTEDLLILLLIGELVHIGRNTSFGFGRYHLKFTDA